MVVTVWDLEAHPCIVWRVGVLAIVEFRADQARANKTQK